MEDIKQRQSTLTTYEKITRQFIPYLLKALSAGLISVGGLVFLGKEPSYSEQTLYASTFALGALMGAHSSIIQHDLDITQRDLFLCRNQLICTQNKLNNLKNQNGLRIDSEV